MKRNYETPQVEVVKFQYKDQVVAQSGSVCVSMRNHPSAESYCADGYVTIYKKW